MYSSPTLREIRKCSGPFTAFVSAMRHRLKTKPTNALVPCVENDEVETWPGARRRVGRAERGHECEAVGGLGWERPDWETRQRSTLPRNGEASAPIECRTTANRCFPFLSACAFIQQVTRRCYRVSSFLVFRACPCVIVCCHSSLRSL